MKDRYLTVTALTKYIKRKFDADPHLKGIWLKGEISNFKHHSRGHMYLTIKDNQSRVQAVMFAGNNRRLRFRPENGMNVLIKGEISVFEPYGQYQLYIQQMEPDGIGSLYLAFEQLKEKLEKQGYFLPEHKKKLPVYPKHIAIITSPTGAAVRDILTTIRRRYPIVKTTVIPVLVQGDSAPRSIVEALRYADSGGLFDTIILGRGGGSIEELWSFNEEIVAEAIFQAATPIISAVGHETDVTISDFIADLRAPTPTGATELAVPSQVELTEKIHSLERAVHREMQGLVTAKEQQLKKLEGAYAFRYPAMLLEQKEQQLDKFVESIRRSAGKQVMQQQSAYESLRARLFRQHPEKKLKLAKQQLSRAVKQQNRLIEQQIEEKRSNLAQQLDKLTLLNPLEIIKRGFALPYSAEGNIIRNKDQVEPEDRITVKISDGSLDCKVLGIEEANNESTGGTIV
ncbi:exodeoxyribonuclease VII large subunit [Lentibacillus sediminis]|uniref:exodeoxyribonuclease VII large subunit n=1 Tax=Lentibacillus sediminis TaxID=1940529 RepID=UPI000C1C0008|nr:exodeoxyribonuclease VII large subunit [Lentibacillus sediminis]